MEYKAEAKTDRVVNIKVIGVGGAGNNVINRMVKTGVKDVDYVAVNTDKQALDASGAKFKVQIGEKTTRGQGAGADPEVGKRAAEESTANIQKVIENTDMVFITAGMGGGTGTGAGPIIARTAREAGILTVGVVTKPFKFEGKRRMDLANLGIQEMLGAVDALLIIPNDRLKFATDQKITLANAFEIADEVLEKAVNSISELIKNTGFINLDFADVTAIIKNAGFAHMGTGHSDGKSKAEDAAKLAIASPLMETSIDGAKGVLINIAGSDDMTLEDVEAAANLVQEAASPDANIIFGATFDSTLKDEIRVTVIATGFENNPNAQLHLGSDFSGNSRNVSNPTVSMPIFNTNNAARNPHSEDVVPIIPSMNKEDKAASNSAAYATVRPAAPSTPPKANPALNPQMKKPEPVFTPAAPKEEVKPVMEEVKEAKENAAGANTAKDNGEDPFDSIFKIFNTK